MESVAQITAPEDGAALETLTVLIIDDDLPVIRGLSELLEGEGYAVAAATDGLAALNQLRGGLRPCAIVLDLMMPVMDGWDFRHEQMKDAELREIPVIVVTAAGFSEKSVKEQLGQVDFVPKSSSPERLLAAVQRCAGDPLH
jgi:CheY-like chemotaxis protein